MRAAADTGHVVRFNAEAKARYLAFAQSRDARWRGNFRDLTASVTRLATLADGGRISTGLVDAEIQRLQWLWTRDASDHVGHTDAQAELESMLPSTMLDGLDLFDRMQLAGVIAVCRQSRNLSEAGRKLFDRSRTQRTVINDADRLRKYLGRYGLTWERATQ